MEFLNGNYSKVIKELTEKMKEQNHPLVLHTDQGSVYSSRAFWNAHKDYNIKRSMSRAGTPTDNPIIESLNGWIKAELTTDYEYWKCKDVYSLIEEYVYYLKTMNELSNIIRRFKEDSKEKQKRYNKGG